jgi:hypothetical protein
MRIRTGYTDRPHLLLHMCAGGGGTVDCARVPARPPDRASKSSFLASRQVPGQPSGGRAGGHKQEKCRGEKTFSSIRADTGLTLPPATSYTHTVNNCFVSASSPQINLSCQLDSVRINFLTVSIVF